jgi:hypothetical protein
MITIGVVCLVACFCPAPWVSLIGSIILGVVITYFVELFLNWHRHRIVIKYTSQGIITIKANELIDTADFQITDLAGNALLVFQQEVNKCKHAETKMLFIYPNEFMKQDGREIQKLIHYKKTNKLAFRWFTYTYEIDLTKSFPKTYAQLPEQFDIMISDKQARIPLLALKHIETPEK